MSDRNPEDLTRKSVGVLMLHWIEEMSRLSDLLHVLWRSVSYTQWYGNRVNTGDERLVQHIRDSLDNLFTEIEEVRDRLDD